MLVKTIDAILLERLVNADYSAFDEIYEHHWSTLFRIAVKKLGDVDLAMDLVQDLFVDLWQRRAMINIHSGLRAYLISALYHKLFQYFRKKGVHEKHIEQYSLMVQDGLHDIFPIVDYEENYTDVLIAIEQSVVEMPDRMRVVFNLKYQRSLSNHEIAEQLGISLQTVKNQLSKALNLVRQHMQQQQLNPTVFVSLSLLVFF
ncbi:ECF RNA polymerase sigma factor SigW [compost metagenome]